MKLCFYVAKALKILLQPAALRECHKDKTAKICSGSELTKVSIGKYSYIGNKCFVVNTVIGDFCSIADRCCIGGAIHPMDRVSSSPVFHDGKNILNKNFSNFPKIKTPVTTIENDVWIGMGTCIKAGVKIQNGAIIGMGSVVTHDVPAYEVWAGNPAKKIRDRFPEELKLKLEETKWWSWDESEVGKYAQYFDSPTDFISMYQKSKL